MSDSHLNDAVVTFLKVVGPDPTRLHAAGATVGATLRLVAPGAGAFISGLAGRRYEPWGELIPQQEEANMRMTQLAARFPSLRGAPGLLPWNACALDDWSTVASSGEHWAASFLLWAVWNPTGQWRCAPFHLGEAWRSWDEAHRAAALSWLTDPFMP